MRRDINRRAPIGILGAGSMAVVLGVALAAQMRARQREMHEEVEAETEQEPAPPPQEPAMTRQQRRALEKPWRARRAALTMDRE